MGIRPRLERRVFREEVKEYLMDVILRGELKPGDRIVETRVAQLLGVSQAPVREALRDLELVGFVVSSPFRGTQVRQISNEDLVEMYPIRAALEGVGARAAAARMTDGVLVILEDLIRQMREAAGRDDSHAHMEADTTFHQTIVETSANRLLLQFWKQMRLATTTLLTVSMGRRSLRELADRHERILEALRARDPEAAEGAMRQHIEEPGEWVRAAAEAQTRTGAEKAAPPGGSRWPRPNTGGRRRARTYDPRPKMVTNSVPGHRNAQS